MEKEAIDLEDIKSVFKGNEWVVAFWKSDLRFKKNLRDFNTRRNALRDLGLHKFIGDFNKIAYKRFSKALEEGRDKFNLFLLELHEDLSQNDIVPKEVFEFLNVYLR